MKGILCNQFIASELTWNEKRLKVTQTTQYPDEQGTALEISADEPVELTINIRYPSWATQGIVIAVNGHKKRIDNDPGSFVPLTRKWKNGDRIDINIPFELRLESMPDDSLRVAVFYGPLVLAGELGPVDDPAALDPLFVPVLMTTDREPANWMEPVDNFINTFMTDSTGRPGDVQMKPFYKTYNERYSIFWDMLSEEAWKEKYE
jgi:DUF1680 family protein